MAAVPAVLFVVYFTSFMLTASPDSGFNVFTLGAAFGTCFAASLAVASVILLFYPASRPLGLGYLGGVAFVALATTVLLAIVTATVTS